MRSLILVLLWGFIYLILYIPLSAIRKRRQNCLSWALGKWEKEGGYLVIRWARSNRTRWIIWPHFLWLPEDRHHDLQHVISENDEEHLIPEVWFKPRKVYGDDIIE